MDRREDIKPFELSEEAPAPTPPNRAAIPRDDLVPSLPGEVDRGPVPQHPVHLCPNCDYNLTGLTSRRCPECGEPFSLSEARLRNLEKTDATLVYVHSARFQLHKQYIGIGLMLLCFWVLNVDPSMGPRGWLGVDMSPRGWYLFCMCIAVAPVIGMIRFLRGLVVADSFWPLGLFALVLTVLLVLL